MIWKLKDKDGKEIPSWSCGIQKGTKAKREWHVWRVVLFGGCVRCLGSGWDEGEGSQEVRIIFLEK